MTEKTVIRIIAGIIFGMLCAVLAVNIAERYGMEDFMQFVAGGAGFMFGLIFAVNKG
jgi:hypothetical protein